VDLRLDLLGDSIAYGVGASRPGDRLAALLTQGLADRGFDVVTHVLAASGARSAGLARQVDLALTHTGGDDPPERVAVIVVGANDLTHTVPADEAAADLGRAVRRLRAVDAEVVVAPAPDLSVVPHVPPALRPVVRAGSIALRSAQIRAVRAAGGRVADQDGATTGAFEADPALFSGDRFHPSSAGYRVIAEALLPVVLDAAEALAHPRRSARLWPIPAPTRRRTT
jgi:lysophospholipase L1-like esterase